MRIGWRASLYLKKEVCMLKKILVVVALAGAINVSADNSNLKTCVLYNTKADRDAHQRNPTDMCERKTYPDCRKWAELTGKWGMWYGQCASCNRGFKCETSNAYAVGR